MPFDYIFPHLLIFSITCYRFKRLKLISLKSSLWVYGRGLFFITFKHSVCRHNSTIFFDIAKANGQQRLLQIRPRRKTTVGKPSAFKWPSFCAFLCFEMILRSLNVAVMYRIYVAPSDFGRKVFNTVSSIKKGIIMVLVEYRSYTCIIMEILGKSSNLGSD